jgi:hypothetical protein
MVEYIADRAPTKVQGVIERLRKLKTVREELRRHWEHAVASQEKYYNQRHQPAEYTRGQVVGLSTRNFRFKDNKKLAPTYIRVKILERVGQQAYRVALPTQYSRMHDVFPVSLIEPWHDRPGVADNLPLPDLIDDEEEWEVEDIVTHQGEGTDRRYLVKWSGWPVEYNTWEPSDHLRNAQQLLRRYHKTQHNHRKWDD